MKSPVQIRLTPSVEKKLRLFSVEHDINNISEVAEAALVHCLSNSHFIKKLTKKEEEIDY
ncbi:hypothetical protein HCU40_16705 [Pseudanabaena biceps]|nr:hypothetical protein [Pseudanabaena biceps]